MDPLYISELNRDVKPASDGEFPPLQIGVNATGPGTVKSDGAGNLTVPPFVLGRPAMQRTLGQASNNPALFAVATNLTYKWPASTIMLSPRTMTPTWMGVGTITLPPAIPAIPETTPPAVPSSTG